MLVLKRKRFERIVCRTKAGEQIVITLTESNKQFARFGFNAPASVDIQREELLPPDERPPASFVTH